MVIVPHYSVKGGLYSCYVFKSFKVQGTCYNILLVQVDGRSLTRLSIFLQSEQRSVHGLKKKKKKEVLEEEVHDAIYDEWVQCCCCCCFFVGFPLFSFFLIFWVCTHLEVCLCAELLLK